MEVEDASILPRAQVERGVRAPPRWPRALLLALTSVAALAALASTRLYDSLHWPLCGCDPEASFLGDVTLVSPISSALLLSVAATALIQLAGWRRRGRWMLVGVETLAALWCVFAVLVAATSVWNDSTGFVVGSHTALLAGIVSSLRRYDRGVEGVPMCCVRQPR